jgi:hypothetical protein
VLVRESQRFLGVPLCRMRRAPDPLHPTCEDQHLDQHVDMFKPAGVRQRLIYPRNPFFNRATASAIAERAIARWPALSQ